MIGAEYAAAFVRFGGGGNESAHAGAEESRAHPEQAEGEEQPAHGMGKGYRGHPHGYQERAGPREGLRSEAYGERTNDTGLDHDRDDADEAVNPSEGAGAHA